MYIIINTMFPELLKKYDIDYDAKSKILEIKSKVLVNDFYCLRRLKELYPSLIQEIRISQNGLYFY